MENEGFGVDNIGSGLEDGIVGYVCVWKPSDEAKVDDR